MYCFVAICGCVLRPCLLIEFTRLAPSALACFLDFVSGDDRACARARGLMARAASAACVVRADPTGRDRSRRCGDRIEFETLNRRRADGPNLRPREPRPMCHEAGGGEREARGRKSTRIRSYGPRLRCATSHACTPAVCDMCSCVPVCATCNRPHALPSGRRDDGGMLDRTVSTLESSHVGARAHTQQA